MAGRHRSYDGPSSTPRGRTSGPSGSSFPTGLVAVGTVLVLAAGGGYVLYSKKGVTGGDAGSHAGGGNAGASCTGTNATTLTVDASPDVYAAVKTVADGMTGCTHINVTSVESAAVMAYLDGSAKGGDVTSAPDVWIPDSSMWIDIAHAKGVKTLADNPASIAASPLVIGMPKPVATANGWPGKAFGWGDLLKNFKTNNKLQTALPDPDNSGPGLAAVTMLRGVVLTPAGADKAKQQQALQNLTMVYRVMSTNVASSMNSLLTDLPTKGATAATSGGIAAFPATEQKIAAYNTASPATPLVALYPAEGTMMMNYPYSLRAGLDPAHAQAAADFQNLLHSASAVNTLQKAGFREPQGAAAGILTPADGVNPAMPILIPPDAGHTAAATTLAVWDTTSEQTRGLVVMDISGSMGLTVPGQTDPATHTPLTRLQITVAACAGGLQLFGNSSELGLWTFTTKPRAEGGGTIRSEAVPLGPLSADRRSALTTALQQLSVQPGSRNGLYDTILDAYKTVLNGWAENKVNAIVVFTDGKDDGLNSMSADALIGQLNALKAANPGHAVRVMVVALGSGVDLTTLTRITGAANGQALHADTAADIGNAVMAGFAGRLSDQ